MLCRGAPRAIVFAGLLLIGLALGSISFRVTQSTRQLPPNLNRLLSLPQGPLVNVAVLEYEGFFSSLIWIQSIFETAELVTGEGTGDALTNLLPMVIALDPQWKYPYEFAGLVLEDSGKPSDLAIRLLRQGIDQFPSDWRMRVYLGQSLRERGYPVVDIIPVLAPLSDGSCPAPEYARGLALALLEDERKSSDLIDYLSKVFPAINDPLVLTQMTHRMARSIEPWLQRSGLEPLQASSVLAKLLRAREAPAREIASSLLADLAEGGSPRDRAIRVLQTFGGISRSSGL